ncbi:MAG: Zn-dependent alcohol dehydrogenase [SAR202 cluster bacterium]|jgi:S-(hydroxymethyl)glutathione dehydrogenase/alcohol dehydrogenase|nr:Zn-dependent alcohol dehydrogenase [SAR202 cluster bacterium]
MRAAVCYESHMPLKVEELELSPPKANEAEVQLVGAGVCHSDYHFVDGHITPTTLPLVLGHEGAGVVTKIGPGVENVSPGDHIIFSMDAMCGYCRNCTLGRPTLCETYGRVFTMPDGTTRFSKDGRPYYSMVGIGTFADRTVVAADRLVKVRDDVPLEKACLIGCAVITGVGSVVHRAKVEAGTTVVVFGCGGVGLNVIQGAILASAAKIIAVDTVEFKLEKAREMGATDVINASLVEPGPRIAEITGGGADYAFEVVGWPDLVVQAFKSIRPGGTAVMVGVQPPETKITIDAWDLFQDRALIGAFHGSAMPRVDFPWLLDLYMDGRIKLDELITRYRPLDEINEAFEDMNNGVTARTVLTFG